MNQTNKKPLVSIIVPIYMTERQLPRCIESIIAQTYANIEIILVNDGSKDQSGEICDRYAQVDSRIRVLHKENGGVSAARNGGLDIATGDYIGFVDADDWVEPAMCETLLKPLQEKKTLDVSICGWYKHIDGRIIHAGGTLYTGQMTSREALHRMIRGGCFDGYLWNKLFRADLFKDQLGNVMGYRLCEDIHVCEDLLLCCQLFSRSQEIYYNPQPLYHYIIRQGSALRTYDTRRETEFIARKKILSLLEGDKQLHGVAQFVYVQSLLNYAGAVVQLGKVSVAKQMHLEASRHIFSVLVGFGVGFKAKLRLLAMYISPQGSIKVWKCFAKKFGVIWTKPEDK